MHPTFPDEIYVTQSDEENPADRYPLVSLTKWAAASEDGSVTEVATYRLVKVSRMRQSRDVFEN